ncbi:MAG TPA: hypothetical protein ENK31_09185 [Nannocystis exedens]|nr:hypothetical protein [Nannocystis exedens]
MAHIIPRRAQVGAFQISLLAIAKRASEIRANGREAITTVDDNTEQHDPLPCNCDPKAALIPALGASCPATATKKKKPLLTDQPAPWGRQREQSRPSALS